MRRTMMKSKIHRATVTGADLDYAPVHDRWFVLSGTVARHGGIEFIVPHAGATLPMVADRVNVFARLLDVDAGDLPDAMSAEQQQRGASRPDPDPDVEHQFSGDIRIADEFGDIVGPTGREPATVPAEFKLLGHVAGVDRLALHDINSFHCGSGRLGGRDPINGHLGRV